MADAFTGVDALGIYHTGAGVAGDPQPFQASSLGGERSGSEVHGVRAQITGSIPPLRVDWISGAMGEGRAEIATVDADTVQLLGVGSTTHGAAVEIADGETKLLIDGDDESMAVRVTREWDDPLGGSETDAMMLDCAKPFNNVIGQGNVIEADRAAGLVTYRAVMLYARANLTSVTVWNLNTRTEVGTETPSSGAIQEIADEETAPSAVTFDDGVTEGTGIAVGSITSGNSLGLWIKRTVTAMEDGSAEEEAGAVVQFTAGGTEYAVTLYGLFRIAEDALALYEVYIGVGSLPNLSAAPEATNATLPIVVARP